MVEGEEKMALFDMVVEEVDAADELLAVVAALSSSENEDSSV